MIQFKNLHEKMAIHQSFDDYLKLVSKAYIDAPSMDATVVSHWKALIADDAKLFQRLLSKVKVEWVSAEPYDNYVQLKEDVEKNHHLAISEKYLEHPIFSRDENLVFRAVHDYFCHVLGNHPFGGHGEIAAYNLGLKLYSKNSLPALFTEVVGQAAVAVTTGSFPEQKIALLHGFDYYNLGQLTSEFQPQKHQQPLY